MKSSYAAAIIGAGPAGCAAAIALARQGLSVVLIEASAFPRHRPGESLHPGVDPIFETLGVAEAVNQADFLRYDGHRVVWEMGERIESFGEDARGKWQGYQAWRPTFDRILLDAARAAGAEVLQPCKVRKVITEGEQVVGLVTDKGVVRSQHVLDASGQCQWLSRQLNISTTSYSPKLLARFGYVACDKTTDFSTPIIRSELDGWSWMAQVTEDRCAWSRMRVATNRTYGQQQTWQPAELSRFEPIGREQGADVTWRLRDRLSGSGWFLLGDAAAVLDPAASHGVLRSLMSGIQAAHVIAAREHGDISEAAAQSAYHQWLSTWVKSDIQRMRELYRIQPKDNNSESWLKAFSQVTKEQQKTSGNSSSSNIAHSLAA